MIMRKLSEADIPQAKALWKHAFSDSDEFINNYFENRFIISDSLGVFDGERLAADLTMQQKVLSVDNLDVKAAFIAGVATHNDYRNRGLCRDLFIKEYEILKNEGYAFCMLYPFLHEFYRKLGFETISDIYIYKDKTCNTDSDNKIDTDAMFDMHNAFLSDFDIKYKRSKEDFMSKLSEHFSDGGKAVMTDKAYALYEENEDSVYIVENTAKRESEIKKLIALINGKKRYLEFYSAIEFHGFKNSALNEHTMARIIDVKAALKSVKLPECDIKVNIKDELCPWNEYNIRITSDGNKTHIKEIKDSDSMDCDIREITKFIYGKSSVLYKKTTKKSSYFFDTF